MKKYVVTVMTSIEVQAETEELANKVAERYQNTGMYGMGKNRVLKVEGGKIVQEVA
ncbi:MAG: hypothetical protein IKB96_10605 [Prevotella sp.]|nr:hypothetical protein [Prevotella sp.]